MMPAMINPPSCLVGNLPNNLDIDINEAIQSEAAMNGMSYATGMGMSGAASGQVDMNHLDAMAAETPHYLATGPQGQMS